jgi:hypothetical protein
MATTDVTPSKVFVPGGMPVITYVSRDEGAFEKNLQSASDNLCKLVTLTGSTKSGKTVLANRIFPRGVQSIWVDGGLIDSEETFWRTIHSEIDPEEEIGYSSTKTNSSEVGGEVQAEGSVPFFAKTKAKGSIGRSDGTEATRETRPVAGIKARTIKALREVGFPLIVDDFHYITREIQGSIVRALKPLIFDGHPVIFIAIPHRRYDVVRVEREMTGRILPISVPSWSIIELKQIAEVGFNRLKMNLSPQIINEMAENAYGSPHLMQEFCREVAKDRLDGNVLKSENPSDFRSDFLFKQIADATGKIIFDKLAKGPRQRSDRMQRPLVGGGNADIYRVVLLALCKLSPGLEVIDYESLRQSIRQVLEDSVPQAHEVTRVLEKMAEIASKDENSVSVLDWDKDEQRLHITDPFFAFFLKWSEEYIRAGTQNG